MADLRAAILNAAQAADRMHLQYDTKARADEGEGRIDVFGMLVEQGILTMFQRLDKLLGAFLDEDGSKGVIVTTQRQLPVQRFTAAHELGHAMLGHQPSADPEEILARSPVMDREDGRYDVQEIQANMFASQLLIPRWLLITHLKRQKWAFDCRPQGPPRPVRTGTRSGASSDLHRVRNERHARRREGTLVGAFRRVPVFSRQEA
jgi:IrrE N-terminal-like domain